jgi:hypothetical protein
LLKIVLWQSLHMRTSMAILPPDFSVAESVTDLD